MQEEKNIGGDIRVSSPFLKKIENFFYHYKWHTVIALFLVVVIVICSVQMCTKEEYDIEIMYAGRQNVTSEQAILDIEAAFGSFSDDVTGDGVPRANLVAYWVDERYLGIGQIPEELKGADVGYFANQASTNRDSFDSEITAGNVMICLLSPYLFERWDERGAFLSLTEACPEYAGRESTLCLQMEDGSYNPRAVLLSKTALGDLAGLAALPEDTVICIRKVPYNIYNKDSVEEEHARALEVYRRALRFGSAE